MKKNILMALCIAAMLTACKRDLDPAPEPDTLVVNVLKPSIAASASVIDMQRTDTLVLHIECSQKFSISALSWLLPDYAAAPFSTGALKPMQNGGVESAAAGAIDVRYVINTDNDDGEFGEFTITSADGTLSKTLQVALVARENVLNIQVLKPTAVDGNVTLQRGDTLILQVESSKRFSITAGAWLAVDQNTEEFRTGKLVMADGMVSSSGAGTQVVRYLERCLSADAQTADLVVRLQNGILTRNVRVTLPSFTISNNGADTLPDDVRIAITGGGSNGGQYGSNAFAKSYDGDAATFYESAEHAPVPCLLTWSLQAADRIDYLVYTPRTDNINGAINELDILVKHTGSAVFESVGSYAWGASREPSRVEFIPALENVAEVQFSVRSASTTATTVNTAEIAFYKKGTSSFDPLTLFTDASCSELRQDISLSDVNNCPVALYQHIAQQLMNPATADAYREFRIGEFGAYYNPQLDASRNKTAQYSIRDNPTGIKVDAGDELIVFVSGIPAGQNVSLKVQGLSAYTNSGYVFSSASGPSFMLANGVNKIHVPSFAAGSGLIYVQYQVNTEMPLPDKVKIHFASGCSVNGYYDSRRHTSGDYARIVGAAAYDYFDVIGKYAAITFKTAAMRSNAARGRDFIDAMDSVVWIEWKFAGLLPPPLGYGGRHRTHAYFVNLPMSEGVGAYATDYFTAYPDGTCQELANPRILLNEDGSHREVNWVLGHEHGHVNQLRPAFKWVGMTEVTNNIMANYLQTNLGDYFPSSRSTHETSRLLYSNYYETAANYYFVGSPGDVSHGGTGRDVWKQLVPFWQLHLYLTEVLGKGATPSGLYADVYEHYRSSDPNAGSRSNGEHQLEFVKVVCQKANLNLENFFRAWGFLTPVDVTLTDYGSARLQVTQAQIDAALTQIRQYPAPADAKEFQYITDANVGIFRDNAAMAAGGNWRSTTTFSHAYMPDGWTNAVAFELRDGSASGTLKAVLLMNQSGQSKAIAAGDKIYAVSAAGDRVEVPR